MNELFQDQAVVWAAVLVIVIPIAIISITEIEERLRQRDSTLTGVISTIRRWTIPLFAVWAVARGLFGVDDSRLVMRLVGTALLLTLAVAALQVVRLGVAALRSRSSDDRGGVPALILALPRVVVVLTTIWLLLEVVWGVDLSAALTALGVTSLIVSFALQDTLSGLASGVLLLSDAPFQPGDWIKFDDLEGKVVDINWRSSRIENRNGDLVVVPNAILAAAMLVNYDQPTRLHRVVVPVQVAYVNPPTLAKEMLLNAADSTPDVLKDPPPGIRVVQIDDPLMGYEVHLWIDDFKKAPRVSSDFGSLVWYMSHRHNVPLPSPAYDLYNYDGLETEAAGRPDPAEIGNQLKSSPLLNQLNEDDLSRMAAAAQVTRFARGEVILEGTSNRSLYFLWSGQARIVVDLPDGGIAEATELTDGDVFGLLSRFEGLTELPRVIAITDCEVVIVAESAAGNVASRNPALSEVLNQLASVRGRRIERMLRTAPQETVDKADRDVVDLEASIE